MLENLEIYANGQNLFTWSPLPDSFDPKLRKWKYIQYLRDLILVLGFHCEKRRMIYETIY